MPIINMTIRRKKISSPQTHLVCGNTDYQIAFNFDSEWSEYDTKTARFYHNGAYTDVVFTGYLCDVPKITNADFLEVGVFAGDLRTTTPGRIECDRSILCRGGSPVEPHPDVYAQLMELLNSLVNFSVPPSTIAAAVEEYMAANPLKETDPTVPAWAKKSEKPTYTADEVGAISLEKLNQAAQTILAQAKASGVFDGAPGKDGQDGVNGADGVEGPAGERGLAIYRASKKWLEWSSEFFDFSDLQLPGGYAPKVNDLVITENNYLCWVYEVNEENETVLVASFSPAVCLNGGLGPVGSDGKDGVTYTPSVTSAGVLSWTNDGGKQNPSSVNIKGPAGSDGKDGDTPYIGSNGNWWIGGTDTGVAATGSGSGGASVQADWGENDETKLSHVKGRTHWKEESGSDDVILDAELTWSGTHTTVTGLVNNGIVKGQTYIVTWNDVEYECVGKSLESGETFLGNRKLFEAAEDTGESFAVLAGSGNKYYLYKAKISDTVSRVKVQEKKIVTWHKMDPGYLPDGVPYTEEGVVELLPETTVEFDPDTAEGYILEIVSVEVGNECIVVWNGVEYVCTAQSFDMDGMTCAALGDLGVVTGGTSTGEPFTMVLFPPEIAAEMGVGGAVFALDGSTSATMRIAMRREIVHPVPGKFLPDYLPRIENKGMEILPETTIGSGTEEAGPFVVKGFVWEDGVAYDVTINDTVYRYVVKQNIGTAGMLRMEYVLVDNKGTLRLGPISFYGGEGYIYVRYAKSGDRIKIEGPIRYYKLNAMLVPETTAPLVLIWGEDSTGTLFLNATERELLEAVRSYRPVILWDASNRNASATCYTFSYWSGGTSFQFYSPCAGNKNASVKFDSAEVGTVTFGN